MLLNDLAIKYGTDKSNVLHNYCEHYQNYLPQDCRSLLEIGAAKGASALMWRDYYPDCDIHILDLFLNPDFVSVKWCRERFFVPHQGDQGDLKTLSSIQDQFEVIIDDGSHRADHQLISFKHLFLNNLRTRGVYAIEDCHCNRLPFYWGDGFVTMFEFTALSMFNHFKATGEIVNPYFNKGESAIFKSLIDRVEVLEEEKLILIWRK